MLQNVLVIVISPDSVVCMVARFSSLVHLISAGFSHYEEEGGG